MTERGESIFEDVTLVWKDREYHISSNRVMGAIARIEEHLTLHEISTVGNTRGTFKMTPVACAFASLLRYAGAEVTDEEVYAGMFHGKAPTQALSEAVIVLVNIMVPPADRQDIGEKDSQAKNSDPVDSDS